MTVERGYSAGATMRPRLTLIVPAYNEVERIDGTLDSMQAYLDRKGISYEIIVAADGDDGTRERVAERGRRDGRVTVFGSRGRCGKGKGIREAVVRAEGEIVGFADADAKTPIDELEKILPWLDQGFPIVIGSRALGDSVIEVAQPLHRRLGSRAFAFVLHVVVGLKDIHDTQCGFKFFRRDVAQDLFGRQRIDGYMFDVEILYLAERAGYRIKQVGVRWKDDGDSRLRLLAGNFQNMIDIMRIRFSS